MSLPEDMKVIVGARLVYKPTGEEFRVLCSCPNSKPRHYTRRYIMANRSMYEVPQPQKESQDG